MATAKASHEWKGHSVRYALGVTALHPPVPADTLLISVVSGPATKTQVRVIGDPESRLAAGPWRQVSLWPRPGGEVWVAALDHASEVTVVDRRGAVQWTRSEWPTDIMQIVPGGGARPAVAILRSDEKVLAVGSNGDALWEADLRALTQTAYGNVPFRGVWNDLNGDGTEDLVVGQFCFETALDGRQGRLMGSSQFISHFWPLGLAVTGEAGQRRVWCAPAYSSTAKFWDFPGSHTHYLTQFQRGRARKSVANATALARRAVALPQFGG